MGPKDPPWAQRAHLEAEGQLKGPWALLGTLAAVPIGGIGTNPWHSCAQRSVAFAALCSLEGGVYARLPRCQCHNRQSEGRWLQYAR